MKKRSVLSLLLAFLALVGLALPAAVAAQDLPKVTLQCYFVGDKPQDMDLVVAEANKILLEKLNTEINIQFLGWSDFGTKYTLVLAGGEDIDIVFTGDWCFYAQEARKGAFLEITDELLDSYMPLTKASQNPDSWEQARVDGKIYCLPNNNLDVTNGFILALRDDLRVKHGLPEVTDIDTLEQFYMTIAEQESGIFGYDASIPQVSWLRTTIFSLKNGVVSPTTSTTLDQIVYWTPGQEISLDDLVWLYETPTFIEYSQRMQRWAQAGIWSKNALSNQVTVADAFESGRSASAAWNGSLYNYGRRMEEKNSDWDVVYIDMAPDSPRFAQRFTNDAIAIAAATKYPERAAMALDLMKNDDELNMLLIAGIEGKHWIAVDREERTYMPGPDVENFNFNAFAWGLKPADMWRRDDEAPERVALNENMQKNYQARPFEGFDFDSTRVEAEIAAYSALRQEYDPLLDLGLVADVETTVAEFKAKAQAAGYDRIVAELKAQLEVFLADK